MPPCTHFGVSQFSGLDLMGLALLVLYGLEFLRQSLVEALVQPAEKLRRANLFCVHAAQPLFHLGLNIHVGEMLNLKNSLAAVC